MRSFHVPGRSPVYARRAMCATSHPLASVAAIDVLKRGGNAVDAAIAASAVLAVVEHPMTGIGGDCFAIVAKPGEKPIALNASGRAPAAAEPGWYAKKGIRSIAQQTPHAVTVPGAIDGWATLVSDHGTMALGDLLAPAIAYAEEGFPVAPRVAHDWSVVLGKLRENEGARQHLLVEGRPPRAGEIVRMPALARTLRQIAKEGRDAFYQGEIAEDIVSELRALGGLHTVADFAAQRSSYVEPISVAYRGVELVELPPSNQGVVALMLLKMLAHAGPPPGAVTSAERYHFMIEAARLAYGMRDAFVADPDMASVPVGHLLADKTIAALTARIDPRRRLPQIGPLPQPAGSDTIYLTVVDANGMAVSFINSLFAAFGSGIVTRKTGIVLQNRGQGFVLDPAHPNCIAPRKRPMHTLVPALVMKDGAPYLSFGVMGGAFQAIGHAYVLTNMVDYGLDPQEALDTPRMFLEGEDVLIEEHVPAETVAQLRSMGHRTAVRSDPWGGGQIVCIDRERGVLIGASDARKDGCALGY